MNCVSWVVGTDNTLLHLWKLIEAAEKSVFISTFLLDWASYPVRQPDLTFSALINRVCKRGVSVNILLAEGGDVSEGGQKTASSAARVVPTRCTVRIAKNFGPTVQDEMLLWTKTVTDFLTAVHRTVGDTSALIAAGQRSIFGHRQCYVVIDDRWAMLGGVYLVRFPSSSATKHHFHAVTAIASANEAFCKFAHRNWESAGKYSADFRLTRLCGTFQHDSQQQRTTLDKLCHLIDTSKRYLYLESESFISCAQTHNTVATRLVERLLDAHRFDEEFRIVIFVNRRLDRWTYGGLSNVYHSQKVNLTLDYIVDRIRSAGVKPGAMKSRVFVGQLCSKSGESVGDKEEGINIKGTVCIQDGARCIVGSSGISDRTLAAQHSELSFLIEDEDRVQALAQYLWRQHTGRSRSLNISIDELFDACLEQEGNIRRFRKWEPRTSNIYNLSEKVLHTLTGQLMFS